jgi:hypothetical protein
MVPIGFAAHPVWALRSWDRFRVPWPFARVRVSHGAPFAPPVSPAAETGGALHPAASPAAEAAGISGAGGSDVAAESDAAADAVRECARREFERALAAVVSDVRARVGERL